MIMTLTEKMDLLVKCKDVAKSVVTNLHVFPAKNYCRLAIKTLMRCDDHLITTSQIISDIRFIRSTIPYDWEL